VDSAAAGVVATDMTNDDKKIGGALAIAACGLIGASAPTTSIAAESDSKWDIDSAFLYYGESDGRAAQLRLLEAIGQ
jgi:hypothetical protein